MSEPRLVEADYIVTVGALQRQLDEANKLRLRYQTALEEIANEPLGDTAYWQPTAVKLGVIAREALNLEPVAAQG